jgi:hypothetical protein
MTKPAVEVLQAILDNPKDVDNVRSWTSPDVTHQLVAGLCVKREQSGFMLCVR